MILSELDRKRRTMVSCSIIELVHMYRNGQIATREINQLRVRSIKNYLLDNALTKNIYLPPLVASSREGAAPNGDPIELSIIDGTQRIAAFAQLEDSILKALKKGEEKVKLAYELDSLMKDSSIAIQVFEGLTRAEESQLYLDLNLKGKKVALSKRISFDSRNNLNVITNQVLHTHQSLKTAGVELEKRSINRPANKNLLSLSQLRQVIGIFMTGKAHVNIEEKVSQSPLSNSEYITLIHLYLNELFDIYPAGQMGDYTKCMLASYPLFIAVALYANDKMENQPIEQRQQLIATRMSKLKEVDWSPDNPIWKEFKGTYKGRPPLFHLSKDKNNIEELVRWLYSC
ncbi:DNA sulfur modification protein DndB [Peribacillus frigoritolerans]|uniref:DNA sulfur modification protein DndB n=1 Tax=Peribacillus castrilensis TaxID=2897690 RepID=UPI002DC36954|nr:DNA sulfur modification protein DndB [Peribacillus castrilensis]